MFILVFHFLLELFMNLFYIYNGFLLLIYQKKLLLSILIKKIDIYLFLDL